jgi:hypothetical protein
MKRLATIFLILFTILTFNNTASAGFFGDIFKELFGELDKEFWNEERGGVNNVRCKIEYTQLDLTTGLEKTVKHTSQFEIKTVAKDTNIMYLTAQDFTDQINDWLNESKNNVITNMTAINCKERRLYASKLFIWNNEQRWGEYKSCPDEYNLELMDLLEGFKQWGYNVNIARLIKDYDEGCKNYYWKA